MTIKSLLLCGISVTVSAAGLPVQAQALSEAGSLSETSGEIVVTAQRREERLSEVPISITALTGETLNSTGIDSGQDLGLVTPGLNYAVQGAFAQPTIRGIGTSVTGPGSDANVALYIDGVYQPNQSANLFEFNGIERIEVLKGPQGTLFGRNATGGAIRVITADPDQDARGQIDVGYGRFDERKISGFVNLPLSEAVAVNVSGLLKRDDGYIKNLTTGRRNGRQDVKAIRAKLKLDATERLSFVVGYSYSDTANNAPFANNPIDGNNAARQRGVVFPTGFYQTANTRDPVIRSKLSVASLTTKLDLGIGEITSITAYQKIKPYLEADIDGSSLFLSEAILDYDENNFTQEVNFASDLDGPLNFVAGVYYYYDNTKVLLTSKSPAATLKIDAQQKSDAESVYAEATYDITDRLHLTGGIRYSSERKRALGAFNGTTLLNARQRDDGWTPRAVVRYELDDRSNIYGSYSRGFKSGTFNVTGFSPVPVRPEKIDAFEVGYKRAEAGFQFDFAAYYYKYDDIQVQIQQNLNGILSTVLQNAASAEIYGAEASATLPISSNFKLQGGLAYTHARYEDFKGAIVTMPLTNPAGVPIGGNSQGPGDASGNEMIRTPEFTANLTGTYSTQVGGGDLDLSLTGSYNSGFYWDPANLVKEDPYFILNANASWLAPGGGYRVSVWSQNITNTQYRFYVNNTTTGNSGSPARPWSAGGAVTVYF